MKNLKKVVIVIGIAVAVSGATVAFAQDDLAPEAPEIPAAVALCLEANQTAREAAFSEALGITVEEFQEMRSSEMTLREIAEELGVDLPERGSIEFEAEDCRGIARAEVLAAAAEQLGLTVDELQAMFDEGMTLREIAEEQGIELDLPHFPGGPRNGGPATDFDRPQHGGPGGNFDGPRNSGPWRFGPRGPRGGNLPEAPATEDGTSA